MKITDERKIANEVLEIVLQEIENIDSEYCAVIGSYQNGREQGHSIRAGCFNSRWIGWSEFRRSDDIVVYAGLDNMQSISDEMYENKKFFDTPKEAADYIMTLIKEDLETAAPVNESERV